MASGTRSRRLNDEPKADHPAPTSTDETSPTQKRKPGAARTVLNAVLERESQSSPRNVSPFSAATTNTSAKRKNRGSDDESDETQRTVETPTRSSRFKRKKVFEKDSRESATKETRSNDIKKVRWAAMRNIVANNFRKALVNKGIKASKGDMQGFETLEIEISNSQTAVRWKKDTEPQFSWLKLPYTATLDKCSVFAVAASTEESFERKAMELFMSDIIWKSSMEPSIVLVLHHNRTGTTESAIVGCWVDGIFRYCDNFAAATADTIAKELSGTNEPLSWHLGIPGKGSLNRRKVSRSSVHSLAKNDSDAESQ